MNRKTARGLLAVALVCAAALPVSATALEFTGWECAIELPKESPPHFSPTLTGDEIFTSKSKLECEQEFGTSEAELECRTTLNRRTLNNLGIGRHSTRTFDVPCRIDARRCNVGLEILQVTGKLTIKGRNGKTTLKCESEE